MAAGALENARGGCWFVPVSCRDEGSGGSFQPGAVFQPLSGLHSLLGCRSQHERGGGWSKCVLTVNMVLLFINAA